MKRILLSIVGTLAGLVGLLSYKSHGTALVGGAALPSAAMPAASAPQGGSSSSAGSSAGTSTGTSTGAAPNPAPSSSSASTSSAAASTQSFVGSAIQTRYGVVQVKVTVSGRKITDVSFVQLTAYDGRSQ